MAARPHDLARISFTVAGRSAPTASKGAFLTAEQRELFAISDSRGGKSVVNRIHTADVAGTITVVEGEPWFDVLGELLAEQEARTIAGEGFAGFECGYVNPQRHQMTAVMLFSSEPSMVANETVEATVWPVIFRDVRRAYGAVAAP
jgi:hypothetical protein